MKNTPSAILQMECSISALSTIRFQIILRKLHKIQALPFSSPLQISLRDWWFNDRQFEPHQLRPRSFFGAAFSAHFELFNSWPSSTHPIYSNPSIPPPWLINPIPVNIHKPHWTNIRAAISDVQAGLYNSTNSIQHYRLLHPNHNPKWPHSRLESFIHILKNPIPNTIRILQTQLPSSLQQPAQQLPKLHPA